jgi:hypothetical protein
MNKLMLFLFVCLLNSSTCYSQNASGITLFVIDSIPLINDPEPWNPITKEDISDVTVINNKDSIKALGWPAVDVLIFVFTKAYRNRADSIKLVPSLKQMKQKDGIWYFKNKVYTGKYIDYYNNGSIEDEGNLVNGILNGELIIYRKNGNKRTVSHYKDGKLHGVRNEFYPNGAINSITNYINGKWTRFQKEYFINGQLRYELRQKNKTLYDSSVFYYSNGSIKKMRLLINSIPAPNKKAADLDYYDGHFSQSLNAGRLKEANRYFYKLWLLDSISSDTHFKEGLLLLKEFQYDGAIKAFDEALAIEPLMGEALAHRALARLKKYKYASVNVFSKDFKESWLTINDIIPITGSEQNKICSDLHLAREVDATENYVQRIVPFPILDYCERKY